MSSNEAAWTAVLDAMEERLNQAQFLLEGEDFSEVAVPLSVDGPIPPSLAGRAQSLLDATREMEQKLDAAMAGLSVQMAVMPPRRADYERPAPTYIDRSA